MLYFPQLSTGAVAQYSIQKRRLTRTVVNEALDGARGKLSDPNAAAVEWILDFQSLSDDERDSLAQLYGGVEGRRGDFYFFYSPGNLLLWGEELDEAGLGMI